MKIEGTALCMGQDIDTDVIIAGRYLRTRDRQEWARHAFEDLEPSLASRIRGAVNVAGKNFGCGSSREQAAIALKEAGVKGVIAPSFARIFYRNAINIGLPVIECDCTCQDGEAVAADPAEGTVMIGERSCKTRRLSPRMLDILSAGGLVEYWRKRR